jgi:sugar/nucleoside kinase (ribokinase family)
MAAIVPLVVVKTGPRGALAQKGQERFVAPPMKVRAVDPVGAGDSFDAGFLSQYVRSADLAACLAAGNLAGALSTTRPGGTEAFRDAEYREQFFREHGTRDFATR